MFGAEVCVSALWHFQRCIAHLQTLGFAFEERLADILKHFNDECDVQNLAGARQALGHIEDRVSHLDMNRLPMFKHTEPFADVITVASAVNGSLRSVDVLGVRYEVAGAIGLALAAEQYLFRAAEQLLLEFDQAIDALDIESERGPAQ